MAYIFGVHECKSPDGNKKGKIQKDRDLPCQTSDRL